MRGVQIALLVVLVCAGLSAACASRQPPLVIWHRNAPDGWTPPEKYAGCTVRGEKVIENGQPNGRDTIRLDCPDRIVFLDTRTKRVVWQRKTS